MVSSISSGMSMPAQQPRSVQSLTDEQLTLISDTLSELDADSLTEAQAVSIVESFSEAGIAPSKEMEEAISALGFDAKDIGDLAGIEGGRPEGMPPPPPPEVQSATEINEMVSFLEALLEEKLADSDSSELNEQDKEAIYSKVMEQFGIEEGDSLINTTA
nr:hypothetical protein BCCFPMHH_00016 [uncultured bacterium]